MSGYSSPMLNKKLPNITQFTSGLNIENWSFKDLNGKVVLLQFWTFGCYNCKNTLPYMKQWYNELSQQGIQVISIHTPEFDYESKEDSVRQNLDKHGIEYPVLLDNDYKIWNSFHNRWWPHFFLIDRNGIIRYNFVGEGQYDIIKSLLLELNSKK